MKTSLIDLHWEHPSLDRIKGVLSMTALSGNIEEWRPRDNFWNSTEMEAWSRLKFFKRQRQYVAGRYAAKAAVSKWLGGAALNEFGIHAGVFQQPVVRSADWEVPLVSIGHTDDCGVALAVPAGFPIGIDIEDMNSDRLASVQSIFQQHFGRAVEATLPPESAEILEWTAHESLSKALLVGLTYPFEKVAAERIESLGVGFWRWTWRDFSQYQTLVFILGAHIIAMTYPKHWTLMGNGGDERFAESLKDLRKSDPK